MQNEALLVYTLGEDDFENFCRRKLTRFEALRGSQGTPRGAQGAPKGSLGWGGGSQGLHLIVIIPFVFTFYFLL